MKKPVKVSILLLVILILAVIARPLHYILKNYLRKEQGRSPIPRGFTDDASRLNRTKIDSLMVIPSDSSMAIERLREIFRYAQQMNLKISIAGARHSMGGQTIAKDGILIDMRPFRRMILDEKENILRVQAGALWSEIIPFLNQKNRSIAVMQSNNSFTVGGSISVNCHGWQPNGPPIASTVESFTLMKADGSVVRCSRTENAELFSLVLGGYGLFGVILEVVLKVVPNDIYEVHTYVVPAEEYIAAFDEEVNHDKDVGMAYGRLDVTPDHFLSEAILNVFTKTGMQKTKELADPSLIQIKRSIFRGSVGSDYGKKLRWDAEKNLGEFVGGKYFSRNQLLNEEVEIYENRDSTSTDILHEYFIPRSHVADFIRELRRLIPNYRCDLLNITLRNVYEDKDAFLAYAHEEVFGFVMLFNQSTALEGERQMELLTQELIEAVSRLNGTYYLPYRLHATKEQFYRIYPDARNFFQLKLQYDPEERFVNRFYEKYK